MTITYSDYILQGKHVIDNIQKLKEFGADGVEMLMDGTCWDDKANGWKKLVNPIKETCMRVSIHPPSCDTNLTAEMETLREASFSLYRDSIYLAAEIDAASVVIHPGFTYSSHFDKLRAKHYAEEYLNQLIEIAKPLGVKLFVEKVGCGHASLYTQEEYTNLLVDADPIAGYLIDTGHAHINHWNIPKLIEDVSDRLYGMHIHDNVQRGDVHLHIGTGTIPWDDVFVAMRGVRKDCDLILEYSPEAELSQLPEAKNLLIEKVLSYI